MTEEKVLVLIKPDAMARNLSGIIIHDLSQLKLKMIGLKLVSVQKHLAEKHYEVHKEKPFYPDLLKYIMGEYHNVHSIIAIAYNGENAVQKLREYIGLKYPDEADPISLRGRYGKVNSKTKNIDNVIHASDSPENGEKEISIWFDKDELVE
ncbi:MAG TPA: nucleoside-diphosphate kinase [Candidatus Pacearchaeota archaeon]|nr:nucleoside-diphosphate kinase [Candidatus Pacearchaeota archaeon]